MSEPGNDEPRAPSKVTRILRIICVCTFIPALGFNLAHGIVFNSILPAMGLLPHAFSVGLAIYELGWLERLFHKHQYRIILQDESESTKPSATRDGIVALMDFLIGSALLGCIVGGYILMAGYRWYYWDNASRGIVGTYATLPFIVNAYVICSTWKMILLTCFRFIHGYFLLKAFYQWSKKCTTPRKPPTCPHCRATLSSRPSTIPSVADTPRAEDDMVEVSPRPEDTGETV
jgi:hypothetical protein